LSSVGGSISIVHSAVVPSSSGAVKYMNTGGLAHSMRVTTPAIVTT